MSHQLANEREIIRELKAAQERLAHLHSVYESEVFQAVSEYNDAAKKYLELYPDDFYFRILERA